MYEINFMYIRFFFWKMSIVASKFKSYGYVYSLSSESSFMRITRAYDHLQIWYVIVKASVLSFLFYGNTKLRKQKRQIA